MSQPNSDASEELGAHAGPGVQGGETPARVALREALSAAVDDEASELELRRVANALAEDEELRGEWARTHWIGAALRGARVGKPLPAEERPWLQGAAEGAAGLARWSRWAWPAAGAAAAAVAALAVVFSFAPDGQPDAPTPQVAGAPVNVTGAQGYRHLAGAPSDVDVRRANTYMLRHVQQTSMSRAGTVPMPVGTVPFVKVLAVRDGRTNLGAAAQRAGDRPPRADEHDIPRRVGGTGR